MALRLRTRAKRALQRRRAVNAVVAPAAPRRAASKFALPTGADVYDGLTPQSLSLAGLRDGPTEPHVCVVLPPITPDKIFAGVATALEVARQLANALHRPLRVVPLGDGPADALEREITAILGRTGIVPRITVVPETSLPEIVVSPNDAWIVTYWTTAHAADVAARLGVLDPTRIVYLVQDYEPGFHPWSVPYALTRATYHAGFIHLINSRSLNQYLAEREGPDASHGLIFAPHLELDLLEQAAENRKPDDAVRIFFYGRPGKPRNLFSLGVAVLRAATTRLDADGVNWTAFSAGESHPDIRLRSGRTIPSVGTLGWAEYFNLLSKVDVGLTLMLSPHPSHPPLEVATSGGLSITNDLDGSRSGFHERVIAVPAEVDSLATALVAAVTQIREQGTAGFTPAQPGQLGDPLHEVIEKLAQRLG